MDQDFGIPSAALSANLSLSILSETVSGENSTATQQMIHGFFKRFGSFGLRLAFPLLIGQLTVPA